MCGLAELDDGVVPGLSLLNHMKMMAAISGEREVVVAA
jgi:hypothetical protein